MIDQVFSHFLSLDHRSFDRPLPKPAEELTKLGMDIIQTTLDPLNLCKDLLPTSRKAQVKQGESAKYARYI